MTQEKERGATMVELALALPLTLILLLGAVEAARYVSLQQAVSTASREAARYGSTTGIGAAGVPHYVDCGEIRDVAQDVTPVGLDPTAIEIGYDSGPATAIGAWCNDVGPYPDPSLIARGDRIVVTVSHPYESALPFFGDFLSGTVSATDHRSIWKAES